MAISFLSALLIMCALFCFYKALDLIPTDLGLAWFQGGFTLFSAGVIVLALAFAVRALRKVAHVAAVTRSEGESVAVQKIEPAVEVAPDGDAPIGVGTAGKLGAALAVGAAAGAAATMAQRATRDESDPFDTAMPVPAVPKPADDAILEELERDLFAELPAPEKVAEAGARTNPPPFEVEYTPAASPATAEPALAEPEADHDVQFQPIDDGRYETIAPTEPEPETVLDDGPAAPMTEGLISDHDLAALAEDDWVPLAPIETLEVVGSYDSGGTRFTMYSDGSVVAAGPNSEKRYASLDALRSAIDGRGKAGTG